MLCKCTLSARQYVRLLYIQEQCRTPTYGPAAIAQLTACQLFPNAGDMDVQGAGKTVCCDLALLPRSPDMTAADACGAALPSSCIQQACTSKTGCVCPPHTYAAVRLVKKRIHARTTSAGWWFHSLAPSPAALHRIAELHCKTSGIFQSDKHSMNTHYRCSLYAPYHTCMLNVRICTYEHMEPCNMFTCVCILLTCRHERVHNSDMSTCTHSTLGVHVQRRMYTHCAYCWRIQKILILSPSDWASAYIRGRQLMQEPSPVLQKPPGAKSLLIHCGPYIGLTSAGRSSCT